MTITLLIGNSINGMYMSNATGKQRLIKIMKKFTTVIEKENGTLNELEEIKNELKTWCLAKIIMCKQEEENDTI
jgi:hypothetical protein